MWSLWGEKLQRIMDSEVKNKSNVNLLCWKLFCLFVVPVYSALCTDVASTIVLSH